MTQATWQTTQPTAPGWRVASGYGDRDPCMRRYFDGVQWSAPVHVDDPETHYERARRTPADPAALPIAWLPEVVSVRRCVARGRRLHPEIPLYVRRPRPLR